MLGEIRSTEHVQRQEYRVFATKPTYRGALPARSGEPGNELHDSMQSGWSSVDAGLVQQRLGRRHVNALRGQDGGAWGREILHRRHGRPVREEVEIARHQQTWYCDDVNPEYP